MRARQTAELVAAALDTPVALDERLGGPLDLDGLAAMMAAFAGKRKVLLVGHDPEFSDLAAELVGAAQVPLKKGALARIDTTMPLAPNGGVLRWLIPPDLVG